MLPRWSGGFSLLVLVVYLKGSLVNVAVSRELSGNVDEALRFLEYYDNLAAHTWPGVVQKMWNFNYNITESTRSEMIEARLVYSEFSKQGRDNASRFNMTDFPPDIKRQLTKIMVNVGEDAFRNITKLEELKSVKSQMKSRYSQAKSCKSNENSTEACMPFVPDAENLMAESRDYTELWYLWVSWREATGKNAQPTFQRYVQLSNMAAHDNDQPDKGAMWRSWYEVDDLETQVDNIYEQLRPLYTNLHAYIRRKLYKIYGPEFVNLRGPIPAHLLGHMWSSKWSNLIDIAKPFPEKQATDITPALRAQNYTVGRMFEVANEFYTSMGLLPVPEQFYNKSRLTSPDDGRSVVCHAMAWEFYNKQDFRVSMCGDVNMADFITAHHELGHVQYFLQYRNQPIVYRLSACPAFGEAIGDVVAMSAFSPNNLYRIGLIDEIKEDKEADLNFLMTMALDKIAFLPFAILVDKWRWGVFNGSIPLEKYNTKWWELRNQFQGIAPPIQRNETHFDPVSIYHVSADVSYVRYFLSYIVQFQLHEGLCRHAGHIGPLHQCNVYNSTAAGQVFGQMLRMGISQPWPEAMFVVTGQRHFDAGPIADYFRPLTEWITEQNRQNGDEPGWPDSDWIPPLPKDWKSGDPSSGSCLNNYSAVSLCTSLALTFLCLCLQSQK
ncbi:angiotensin-converting enzyme-like [Asterias amurensis]|uniref:angiotensin-converting enzyme-like n=1 Tax=Asterias amurensis TaxID=7602 RepID=UPI003AB36B56